MCTFQAAVPMVSTKVKVTQAIVNESVSVGNVAIDRTAEPVVWLLL